MLLLVSLTATAELQTLLLLMVILRVVGTRWSADVLLCTSNIHAVYAHGMLMLRSQDTSAITLQIKLTAFTARCSYNCI
jgi:hypothetical protein